MDIDQIIQELKAERERISDAIQSLERLDATISRRQQRAPAKLRALEEREAKLTSPRRGTLSASANAGAGLEEPI